MLTTYILMTLYHLQLCTYIFEKAVIDLYDFKGSYGLHKYDLVRFRF